MSKRFGLALLALGFQFAGCAADVDMEGEPLEGTSEDLEAEVELGSSTQGLVETHFVGVIKGNGVNCPGSDTYVMLGIDNENSNNNNSRSGWVGETSGSSNTYLHFCKVDGNQFKKIRSSNAANNYAVLKLGTKCPEGSVEFTRYFDNNDSCGNWLGGIGACGPYQGWEGNISPNSYGGNFGNNLTMVFCMFRASSSAPTFSFPNLGGAYGVFGGSGLAGVMESGKVYTDDEDDNNNNQLWGSHQGSSSFLEADDNTLLRMARVR